MGRRRAGQAALGGVFAAGALAVLFLACALPSGRLGMTAVAGLFPAVAVLVAGFAAGYLCWGAASALGLVLLPDKGIAVLFLIFLGLYPVVKGNIESLRRLPLEWCLKLLCFNAALALCWLVLRGLIMPDPPAWLHGPVVVLAGNAVFVIYDIGLTRLLGLISSRVVRHRRQ